MKVHHISIQNPKNAPCLDYIKNGIKTVEGRKYVPKFYNIQPNDIIIFHDTIDKNYIVYTQVTYVHKYKTVEEYLEKETLEKTLPWIKTFEDAVKTYNMWSSKEDRDKLLRKYGYSFLGIGIKVITKEEFNMLMYNKYKKQYNELK